MDIKGLSEPKTVALKAMREYDMHGRTVHLIPVSGGYTCADCKQPATEDAGDEGGAHGWLWCGVCAVGG